MAVTKMITRHADLDGLIKYAANKDKTTNPDYDSAMYESLETVLNYCEADAKTEQKLYVTGINVDPEQATSEMRLTQAKSTRPIRVVAYHAIQSFAPGEVSPEVCHEIGVKLAKELWGERFEVVVSTHLNKDNIHNHFVINSVSFVDGKHYHSCKASYQKLRDVSDRLCAEYSLSIIEQPQRGRRKEYAEWLANNDGRPTISSTIRKDIDDSIIKSVSLDQFLTDMRQKGYRFKLDGKYPAILMPGKQKYKRLHNLGDDYTLIAIEKRIKKQPQYRYYERIKRSPKNYVCKVKKTNYIVYGIRAVYFHYMYSIGALPNNRTRKRFGYHNKRSNAALLQLSRLSEEIRLLSRFHIDSVAQLNALKQKLKVQLKETPLSNEVKQIRRDIIIIRRIEKRNHLTQESNVQVR